MGRILLIAAAVLLTATAVIHACGQPMVDGWVAGLGEQKKQAICLVWITASINWIVVSVIWAWAGWKQQRDWLGAAAVAAIIPLVFGAGVMGIEPRFFGGWMLLGSVLLALIGIVLSRRRPMVAA
jgi:hypothetical protein